MSEQRTPEEIRADIEHTREELGETAAALAAKADVKAQVHDRVEETKAHLHERVDEAKAKVTGAASTAKDKASEATPESVASGAQSAASSAAGTAKARPVPSAAIGAFAAGLLAGWIIRSRR